MPFVPDAMPTSAPTRGRFIPDEEEPSISDIPGNAMKDIGGLAKAGMTAAKAVVDPLNIGESFVAGSLQPTKDYISQGAQMLKNIPGAILKDAKDTATHPIDTFIRHPVNTALNVAGAVGLGGEALGMMGKAGEASEAARAGSLAEDVARTAPGAPPPIDLGPEAAEAAKVKPYAEFVGKQDMGAGYPPENLYNIKGEHPRSGGTVGQETLKDLGIDVPPEAEPGISPTGQVIDDAIAHVKNKTQTAIKGPMDEVSDFLTQRYAKVAGKEGFGETLGNMALRKAQSMRFQEMGAAPGQIRKLIDRFGEDKVRALSDLAEEKGITEPIVGYKIGKNIEGLEQTSGNAIGGIRELAAKRGATHNVNELVDSIRQELDPVYLGKGSASGQKGAYLKALEDIKAAGRSPDSLAKAVTKLNNFASKNKMTQATGALSDVANSASKINNELINKYLSPKEAQLYKDSLRDFQASQIYKKFYSFRAGRELAGRSGPGSIIRNLKQTAMDVGGNKLMEKALDKFGGKLQANPGIAKDFGTLTHEALSDILSSLDEVIDETVK